MSKFRMQAVTTFLDIPVGYDFLRVGVPKDGELVVVDLRSGEVKPWTAGNDSPYPWPIVRKTWIAPAWLPDGVWVYQNVHSGIWQVSDMEPVLWECTHSSPCAVSSGWEAAEGAALVSLLELARLHDALVTIPPVDKLQVKRAA